MARADLIRELREQIPWLTPELARVYLDADIEYGEPGRALQEVRFGDGKAVYDRTFPGMRRPDGTLRFASEEQYLSTVQGYRNSLSQRGLNPALFEQQFVNLLESEVSANEFEGRVSAINESIALQSEGFRRAFSEASGGVEFSPEAVLATALDPDGVGRELLDRRIAVAQVRGSALDLGLTRSQQRAEQLLQQGVTAQQVRQFDVTASDTLRRFQTAAQANEGTNVGLRTLEDAALTGDADAVNRLTRLLQRERAAFTSRAGFAATNQRGTLTGLAPTGTFD